VKTLAVLVAALLGSVWGGPAAGAGTAPRTVERPGLPALHAEPDPVEGGRIVDARGREVLLRGVNVNAFAEYWKGNEFAATFPLARRDPARIAGIGWNAVRLLLSWSRVEPEPGEYDEAYLGRIARAVDRFAAEGIYTILDFHQDAWGPTLAAPEGTQCAPGSQPALGWDGAPGWATFDDGKERCAQGGIRELSPAVMAAWSGFFADRPAADGTGIQTRYVDMLAHVAGRFARDPAIAGYDLVNEPNAFSDEHTADLSSMYGRAIAAIRAAEEEAGGLRHLVLFEPPAIWSSTGRGAPPDFPHDDDVVYAPHPYTGDPADAAAFAVAVDEARAFGGAPVLFGEWGGDPDSTTANGETFFVDHQDRQDELRASATLWTWRESCGDPHKVRDVQGGGTPEVWGEFDVDCTTNDVTGPRRDLIADLTHGYVRAAPGRLSSTSYEAATGAFVASGDAGDSTAAVVVFLPPAKGGNRVVDVSGLRRPTTEQVGGGLLLRAVPTGGAWEVKTGVASE
jgi:endoglycosylceramidase